MDSLKALPGRVGLAALPLFYCRAAYWGALARPASQSWRRNPAHSICATQYGNRRSSVAWVWVC